MSKTILITGAGSGIGKDSAFALAARGHRVLATTQTQAQAEALSLEAQSKSTPLEVFKLDITLETDRQLIEPYAIDVLINNAGMGSISISGSGTNTYANGIAIWWSSGAGNQFGQLSASGNWWGSNPSTALASGEAVYASLVYEVA